MDIYNDQLRRELRESQTEHVSAMKSMRNVLSRLFGGDSTESFDAKADFAVGGLNRRRFLQIGGLTVATAAVFAACGSDDSSSTATTGGTGTTGKDGKASQQDLTIMRTASSLEELAVEVYGKAIKSGLVTTAAVGQFATLFQAQHKEHAEAFEGATTNGGGEAFTKPNPVLAQMLEPTLAALKDEKGVLQLAYDLEVIAAQTYQSTVGVFNDASLNQTVMSIGGVEARHAMILGTVLKAAQPPAFQVTDKAVKAGTGV